MVRLEKPRPLQIYDDVVGIIGQTPLVELKKLPGKGQARVFGKLESMNPGGSVKDRICLSMINAAEKDGSLKPGGTIVEPTSGNTGIGLALVAATRGYGCILTMPESMSSERRSLLQSYGAELVLTPADVGMKGAIEVAEKLLEKDSSFFMPQQFNNPANPEIHKRTTAVEILASMEGLSIDAFVAGVGTGGTITGVGEVLKSENKSVRLVAVEPASSALLSGGKPGTHSIQGIGAGFIPKVLNVSILDEVITVKDQDAWDTTKKLAREEGLLVGISSGAAVWAALKVAENLGKGKNVVVVLPDTGERYFSIQKDLEK